MTTETHFAIEDVVNQIAAPFEYARKSYNDQILIWAIIEYAKLNPTFFKNLKQSIDFAIDTKDFI